MKLGTHKDKGLKSIEEIDGELGDYVLSFGWYRGKKLSELDRDALMWNIGMLEGGVFKEYARPLRAYMEERYDDN